MTIIQAIKTIIQQNKQLAELLANGIGGAEYDDTEIKNKLTDIITAQREIEANINCLISEQDAINIKINTNKSNITDITSKQNLFFNKVSDDFIKSADLIAINQIIAGGSNSVMSTLVELNSLKYPYNSLRAIANTLYNFLNNADVTDTTINRWKEIENFLQGITDTDTLTGLLEELQSNIRKEIESNNSNLNEAINFKTSDLFIAYSYGTLVEDELNDVVLKDQDGNVYESAELYGLLEKYHNREIANLTLKADGDTGYVVSNPIVYKHTNSFQILYSSLYTNKGIVEGQLHYDIIVYKDRFKMIYKKVNYING